MKRVYLSGGFVTDWQEEVKDYLTRVTGVIKVAYSPKDFEFEGAARSMVGADIYAPLDKIAIQEADIVFGYLECDNPTPINIVGELCYGKGLGKVTVLVDEWSGVKELPTGPWFKDHYLHMIREWADFVESDFGRALEILGHLVTME